MPFVLMLIVPPLVGAAILLSLWFGDRVRPFGPRWRRYPRLSRVR